jgi:hypothetical protein
MFKGNTELIDPEKRHVVAIFNENCHDDGSALATVRLRTPITLQGTELLEIVGTVTPTPMIIVGGRALSPEMRSVNSTGKARSAASWKAQTLRWQSPPWQALESSASGPRFGTSGDDVTVKSLLVFAVAFAGWLVCSMVS